MIRWRFVLTRVIVILAVLMLVRWGLSPIANFLTIQGLQAATGAKVEISQTRVGLFPPRVQYVGFEMADPREGKQLRNLLRADTIDLVIDGEALLHRRWVARDGKIVGLQIGSSREDSGHFEEEAPEPESSSDIGNSVLSQLVGVGAAKIHADVKSRAASLETIRCSREIRQRWESEYDRLVTQARGLEKEIRDIRDQARGIDNPLRDWPELERTLAKANQARSELMNVREAIDSLPQRMQADLGRLDQARRDDLSQVEQYVPEHFRDSGEFGVDLMVAAVREQIERIQGYLDQGRTLANYTVVAPESDRIRGSDHNLNSQARPTVMIRRCEIGGTMRADGNLYAVTGILENLTPNPELLLEPTRARLRLEGSELIRLEYVSDRRDQQDIDLITLHWPQREAKPTRLGNHDDAGITIQGGQRELWVQVRKENGQIEGRLVSKQTGVKLDLSVDPRYATSAAVVSLQESLASVDRIEVDASFAGTWRDMDLNLNTNLGRVLRDAANQAISGQVREAKAHLAKTIDDTYQAEMGQLQQWLSSRQTEARELLASADKSIEEMSQKVLNEVGDADAYLGRLRGAIRGRLK